MNETLVRNLGHARDNPFSTRSVHARVAVPAWLCGLYANQTQACILVAAALSSFTAMLHFFVFFRNEWYRTPPSMAA